MFQRRSPWRPQKQALIVSGTSGDGRSAGIAPPSASDPACPHLTGTGAQSRVGGSDLHCMA
jgi:hypothetical protein